MFLGYYHCDFFMKNYEHRHAHMHRHLHTAPGKWLLKWTALIAMVGGTQTIYSVSPESLATFYWDSPNTNKYLKCFWHFEDNGHLLQKIINSSFQTRYSKILWKSHFGRRCHIFMYPIGTDAVLMCIGGWWEEMVATFPLLPPAKLFLLSGVKVLFSVV